MNFRRPQKSFSCKIEKCVPMRDVTEDIRPLLLAIIHTKRGKEGMASLRADPFIMTRMKRRRLSDESKLYFHFSRAPDRVHYGL